MTVYDVAAIVIMLGTIGVLFVTGILALSGRKRAARVVLGGLGGCLVAYTGTWVALAVVSKQPPLGVGDPQCVDNWCMAVEDVKSTPTERTIVYDVTLCIFSRANRTPTSFGAHSAADRTTDVYLVDDHGRRYHPLPHSSEIPLNVTLEAGQSVRTRRIFELPSDARNVGLLPDGGSFGACPMIAECSTSHSATDYVLPSGVYRNGSGFLALVNDLRRNAGAKPPQWR
jgi:hypothetical protein